MNPGPKKTERRLYLIRHGRYDPEAGSGLTEPGKSECKNVAGWLAARDPGVSSIFHSGKKRALETAEIFAAVLRMKSGPIIMPGTSPNDDPDPVAASLTGMNETLLLVSHLPFLERLVHRLAPDAVGPENRFLPCSMAVLAFRHNAWTFEEWIHAASLTLKKNTESKEENP
ncbi:histidine phosphatase family protein [bacterium]|nr:histidine phosphatase family protein [bacterium]